MADFISQSNSLTGAEIKPENSNTLKRADYNTLPPLCQFKNFTQTINFHNFLFVRPIDCFLGVYPLLAMDMLFEGFKLKDMKASGHVTEETNVDRSAGVTATFEGNRMAQLMFTGG